MGQVIDLGENMTTTVGREAGGEFGTPVCVTPVPRGEVWQSRGKRVVAFAD